MHILVKSVESHFSMLRVCVCVGGRGRRTRKGREREERCLESKTLYYSKSVQKMC